MTPMRCHRFVQIRFSRPQGWPFQATQPTIKASA